MELEYVFQFTPLREGRRVGVNVPMLCMIEFQFTPLRGGRQSAGRTARRRRCYFNSRPSARGDCSRRLLGILESHFNSRPSARGDANVQPLLLGDKFQFTPLREGRLQLQPVQGEGWHISIHAPPRGATELYPSPRCAS